MAPIGATRAAKNPTQPRVVENPLITPCVDSVDTKTSNPTTHTKRAGDKSKATKRSTHETSRYGTYRIGVGIPESGK